MSAAMQVETKFVRLRTPVKIGDHIDGWRVCWLGGWDRGRLLYVVMVERVTESRYGRDECWHGRSPDATSRSTLQK